MSRPLNRILIVEDDPDIALLSRIAMEEIGEFEVITCGSGSEALDAIHRFEPDLALLDYRLPEMTGAELFAKLRGMERWNALPVIFLTASVMADRVGELMALGALDVIAKPFDPLTLPDQVRAIWDRATS